MFVIIIKHLGCWGKKSCKIYFLTKQQSKLFFNVFVVCFQIFDFTGKKSVTLIQKPLFYDEGCEFCELLSNK